MRRLAAIVASSDDAIVGKDLAGNITSWNNAAERIFGYTAGEIVGTSVMRLIPETRQDEEIHLLAEVARGETVAHVETVRRTRDGTLIDISLTLSPIRDAAGRVIGVSTIARDISAQRRADDARRATEARYRMLFEHAPDGILVADRESNYLDANESMCRMLGYSREELIGKHAADIVAPPELQHIPSALQVIASGSPYQREWSFRRKDGTVFSADVMVSEMPDGTLLAIIRDATERQRHDSRLRRLVDSNAQGVMFWNASGEITGANDAFLRIVGHSREALDARTLNWRAMTPDRHAAADARAQDEVDTRGICTPYEKEYLRSDGTRVPVLIVAASFQDGSGEGLCFAIDLTERKRLEQQLLRAQRMESIGTLAGGIAHDLNNVLAPILLSVEILAELVEGEEAAPFLATLKASAEHGSSLVRQVLSYARGVEGERVTVNPSHTVHELLGILRDTFPKSIEIEVDAAPDLWAITGDPTQIHQVFLNLCVNARDAMPSGGKLTITLENEIIDETYGGMNLDARPGPYVVTTVSDTGAGIAPEIQDRVFEPFFTTRETGGGTGLGLSTTLAVVKSHGGFIHLYSEPGKGTRMRVYFRADRSAGAADGEANPVARPPRGHGELILVIDDEKAIRTIAQVTLERFGYRVLTAANGAEAMALYAVHRTGIRVVLTDMAMPVMDGPATIVALKAMEPSVKIIASSGLVTEAGLAKAVGAGVQHFIPKPYGAEVLLRTLREVLDAP